MTQDEIFAEALKRYPHRWSGDAENDTYFDKFFEGAEWAQEQIIDKACEWLSSNWDIADYNSVEEFVEDLRKALNGESKHLCDEDYFQSKIKQATPKLKDLDVEEFAHELRSIE